MKKLYVLTTTIIALIVLTACKENLNGTWTAENPNKDRPYSLVMTIGDTDVLFLGKIGPTDVKFQGTLDQQEQEIKGTLYFWETTEEMTFDYKTEYKAKYKRLIIYINEISFEFTKPK